MTAAMTPAMKTEGFTRPFRDPAAARALIAAIARVTESIGASAAAPLQIMEVCGGHTHTIYRYGLEQILPDGIEFVHARAVRSASCRWARVDDCVALARRPDVILATFGDAMRVPGSHQAALLQAKAQGADVRVVYSPLDALALGTAASRPRGGLLRPRLRDHHAQHRADHPAGGRPGPPQLFGLLQPHHDRADPLQALLEDAGPGALDGFIGPGHVSMVIGAEVYGFIAETYRKPFVVSGFEPLDILQSLLMVLRQLRDGRALVENQYSRVPPAPGATPCRWTRVRSSAVYELRSSISNGVAWALLKTRACASARNTAPSTRKRNSALAMPRPGRAAAEPPGCACGAVMTGQDQAHPVPAIRHRLHP